MGRDSKIGAHTVEDLHASFAGLLLVFVLRRIGDRQVVEEIVQDTLVRAWRHADRFDADRGALAGWLFTIARNLIIDQVRRQDARPRLVRVPDDDQQPPTDAEVERALEAWQLAEALDELSDEHREAIVQVHYLGFTVRETADKLGVPEGTVKSRLYYGLRALRLRMEEMGVVR